MGANGGLFKNEIMSLRLYCAVDNEGAARINCYV